MLLESVSFKLGNLPIEQISLQNCLSLKTPPPEIVRRGYRSVVAYLKRLTTGSVTCKRTKLMLVGLGEAGKTSLINSMVDGYTLIRPEITDGIVIRDWNIPLPDNTELTYSIWDFGECWVKKFYLIIQFLALFYSLLAGQSVYYNSHQFFLSSRAVYLLVWYKDSNFNNQSFVQFSRDQSNFYSFQSRNVRLGAEYAGLDFWLSSISCHAPGAPIFIVGTHIDEV